ncbi:MAG: hypothetical protein PUC65_09360 [Clostridiales bacterium]|nr:hypothetical protein [Clostridiales bacterium]
MASISGSFYNFSPSLFGSFSAGTSASSGSILGDYYSIRNGSYKKLLTAYYKKQNSETNKETTNDKKTDTNILSTDRTNLTATKTSADKLNKAAMALTATGDDSLFEKTLKSVKDENTGVTSNQMVYDTDKIAKAVSAFAKAYNDTIKSAADSNLNSVLRSTSLMVSQTAVNKNMFAKVGITIGKDNTLTVDETKLKAANMTDVKALFNGSGSYASDVSTKAREISSESLSALTQGRLYGANGKYSTASIAGTLFDQYL